MGIVIFSGTTEGRKISEFLIGKRVTHTVSVATESGEIVMPESPYLKMHKGRMDKAEMTAFLEMEKADLVIDATHPYAKLVTETIKEVCEKLSLSYQRVLRASETEPDVVGADVYYPDVAACVDGLKETNGNILLTTGSKELKAFTSDKALLERIYVRVLPSIEAMTLCKEAGVDERHIIAMYGPHTKEMNEAVIKQFNIEHLVTKESGANGGFMEKIDAAISTGTKVHIINRPVKEEGISLEGCLKLLEKDYLNEDDTDKKVSIRVSLVGIGMGNEGSLTIAGKKAIDDADLILGAKRMVDSYKGTAEKYAFYKSEEVIGFLTDKLLLTDKAVIKAAVLFSGDTGIYSGATKLYTELMLWGKCEEVTIIPGISSFSAFAGILGVSYTGYALESFHGLSKDSEKIENIKALINDRKKLFLILSGKKDLEILINIIPENLKSVINFDLGYNLSYENQRIIKSDCAGLIGQTEQMEDGLYILRISYEE